MKDSAALADNPGDADFLNRMSPARQEIMRNLQIHDTVEKLLLRLFTPETSLMPDQLKAATLVIKKACFCFLTAFCHQNKSNQNIIHSYEADNHVLAGYLLTDDMQVNLMAQDALISIFEDNEQLLNNVTDDLLNSFLDMCWKSKLDVAALRFLKVLSPLCLPSTVRPQLFALNSPLADGSSRRSPRAAPRPTPRCPW
jgi:hypothetical protein